MLSAVETGRVKVFHDLEGQDFTDEELRKPSREEIEICKTRTLQALNPVIDQFQARNNGGLAAPADGEPVFVNYTAPSSAPGFTEASTQRLVRIQTARADPLAPPKFRLKKQYGNGPPSPPTTILRAPTRKLTAEDQANWKIPPAISNWVNPKGLIIPLATRVALDGRGLEETVISDKFAVMAEAMYAAERSAVEDMRQRELLLRRLEEKKRDEEERRLQALALAARAGAASSSLFAGRDVDDGDDGGDGGDGRNGSYYHTKSEDGPGGAGDIDAAAAAAAARDAQREERRRQLEKEMRTGGGPAQSSMARARDVSEQMALGGAAPQPTGGVRFDERLFTRDAGRGTAAGMGAEDAYNLYDQPLFADRSTVGLHRPTKGLGFEGSAAEAAAAAAGAGDGPVQFEKAAEQEGVSSGVGGAVAAVPERAKRAHEAGRGSGSRSRDDEEDEDGGRDKRRRRASDDD
jgi:SNW domain-containing protein 1